MTQDIRHLVVLMLENRSYDHLLGYLSQQMPGLDGLALGMGNPMDPSVPASPVVPFSPAQGDVITPDPDHEFDGVTLQLFGTTQVPTPPAATCNGFVASHTLTANGSAQTGAEILQCFQPHRIPAIATLAREFAVCDRWFSSVPGPTWPNRFFAHCATSDGWVKNDVFSIPPKLQKYTMPSIFEALEANGQSWNVFCHDIPQALALTNLRRRPYRGHFAWIKRFYEAAANGTLPQYTFIEPSYFEHGPWKANDQHGGHSVSMGDTLVAHVYEALRANEEAWAHTMLLIVHDEHGGFFDHVPPPYDGMPTASGAAIVSKPSGKPSLTPPFDFRRLGVRVPAIVVSPYVPKGWQEHGVFEHASIPATVRHIFGTGAPLNARDAAARSFHGLASLSEMRMDTPTALPRASDIDAEREFELRTYDMVNHAELFAEASDEADPQAMNDLQATLYELAAGVGGSDDAQDAMLMAEPASFVSEARAARRVVRTMNRFLSDEAPGQPMRR
jgi:phospholipase C